MPCGAKASVLTVGSHLGIPHIEVAALVTMWTDAHITHCELTCASLLARTASAVMMTDTWLIGRRIILPPSTIHFAHSFTIASRHVNMLAVHVRPRFDHEREAALGHHVAAIS